MAGLVLGMAPMRVTPPARAAAVQEAKSSLWVWPGSRTWTWTSINPGRGGEGRGGEGRVREGERWNNDASQIFTVRTIATVTGF